MADQTDAEAHHAWLILMATQPEKAAIAAHHLRAQLSRATAEIAALKSENERLDAAVFEANSRRLKHEADNMRLAYLTIDALTSPACECKGTGTTVGPEGFRLCERCVAKDAAMAKLKENA